MDGVLVEVSDSYRETIVQTVLAFTGKTISRDLIQEYKNRGGFNNDWILSHRVCLDLGHEISYPLVVETFNRLFLGENGQPGLIGREYWIPRPGLLESLAERFELAIFTGRNTLEAEITLNRMGLRGRFLLMTADDVEREKPAPDGLNKIKALRPGKPLLYVGDTVDDARSARAANVPFIGIAAAASARRDELIAAFQLEGAIRILENINEIG